MKDARESLSAGVRAWIYDALMIRMTAAGYRAVLERLPHGSRLLDVGIGTGSALARNADLVKRRDLHVTGLDIDHHYLDKCRRNLRRYRLEGHVQVDRRSVYDHQGGPYHAVYFSASFMLLPDQKRALLHVSSLLHPGGRIFFTQTFQEKKSELLERIKPQLHRATSVHFGRVTYEDDFLDLLRDARLEPGGFEILSRETSRSFRLAEARLPAGSAMAGDLAEAGAEPAAGATPRPT